MRRGVVVGVVCALIVLVVVALALVPRTDTVAGRAVSTVRTTSPTAGSTPASPTTAAPSRSMPPPFPARLDAVTLRRSIVHMDVVYSGSATNFSNQCTGTKISLDGRVFVMTAAHCLEIPKDDYLAGRPARDATALARYRFAVDVSASDDAPDSPYFAATAIAESQTADVALFRIDPRPIGANAARTLRFEDVPALPIQRYLTLSRTPGQTSTSTSFPASSDGRVVSPGRYLGRARGVNGPHLQALDDIVGLLDTGARDTQRNDACEFGGSGSLAVLSGGLVTGPLSGRLRTRLYRDGTLDEEDLGLAKARINIGFIERALHTNTSPYPTLCLYTVLDERMLRELVALLPR